jgi:hypothetical protein
VSRSDHAAAPSRRITYGRTTPGRTSCRRLNSFDQTWPLKPGRRARPRDCSGGDRHDRESSQHLERTLCCVCEVALHRLPADFSRASQLQAGAVAPAGLRWVGGRRERADPARGSERGYLAVTAELLAFRARAVAECRRPAAISPAEAAMLNPMARAVAPDHDRGRRVTGSIKVPTMHAAPMIAQTAPGRGLGARCRAAAAAATAATGIGHGGATPAPQPATRPAGTDSGTVMPSGWPGS